MAEPSQNPIVVVTVDDDGQETVTGYAPDGSTPASEDGLTNVMPVSPVIFGP